MRQRSIILLESAKQDLHRLVAWLAQEASDAVAHRYVERVRSRIATLRFGAERGTVRDPIRGLRVIGILPHTSLVFTIDEDHVYVLRILLGGQALKLDAEDDQAGS